MDDMLNNCLLSQETDVEGAIKRLSGNDSMYCMLLDAFLEDKTMAELEKAVRNRSWDDAFTAAHALKGLAGNMGFIPLQHSVGELVIQIRAGRLADVDNALSISKKCYNSIISAIKNGQ